MTWDGAKEDETEGPTSLMMVGDDPLEGAAGSIESLLFVSPLVSFVLRFSSEAVQIKNIF